MVQIDGFLRKRCRRTAVNAAWVLILSFGFSGCSKEKAFKDVYRIGALMVLSGNDANYGRDSQRGIDLAAEEINNQGGIHGHPVEVLYEDSKGIPREGATAMQKLVSRDRVPVVIGGIFSSETLAAAPIAERNRVVLFSPGSSSPNITYAGDCIFRNWISDAFEGSIMADFARWGKGYTKVAIVYIKNDYGEGLKNEFTVRFESEGGQVSTMESYEQGNTDFRTQLLKAVRSGPDAIYLPGYYNELAQLLKQARELRINTQFLSVVSFEDPKMLELAGSAAEGVIYSTPAVSMQDTSSGVRTFVDRFSKKYGREPGLFAAHGYDAMHILALAIEKGGFTADGIRNSLYRIQNYPGVSGLTSFDSNGDVIKPVKLKTVRNGKFMDYDEPSVSPFAPEG